VIVSINANPISSNSLPLRYRVSGVIQLPYAEIREPFESWIDVEAGFSRIDYYGGSFFFCFIFFLINQNLNYRCSKNRPTKRT
jgi:hypothetical protein